MSAPVDLSDVPRPRRWSRVLALLGAVVIGVIAVDVSAAEGQDVGDTDALAAALAVDGYVVAEGSVADVDEAETLLAGDADWYTVLAPELDTTPTVLADELRRLLSPATVVVVSDVVGDPDASVDVGVSSDVLGDAEIDAVLDDAAARLGADPSPVEVAAAIRTAGEAATAGSTAGSEGSQGSADDGGGSSGVVVVVVIVVLVVVAVGIAYVVRRKARDRDARDVANARAEISAQLDVVANEILENADRVKMSENPEALDAYRRASAAYSEVSEAIEDTTNLLELGDLADRIDEARWRIEVAEALVEGREPPPEPSDDEPAACFFDPRHRAGTETAVVEENGEERTVRVCRSCRDRLDAGERPEPRLVEVRSRPVPAARAPRSHGGLGLGGLDVFDVIGGIGASTRMPHRWSGPPRGARRSSGGAAGTGRRRMGGGSAGRGRRRF